MRFPEGQHRFTNHSDIVSNAYDLALAYRKSGYAPEVRIYGECDVEVIAWEGIASYEYADDTTPCIVINPATTGCIKDTEVEIVA